MKHTGKYHPQRLVGEGPIIQVLFLPPELAREELERDGLKAVPINGRMLIDTGASSTFICDNIAKRMNLVPHDVQVFRGFDQGERPCPIYRLGIGIRMGDGTKTGTVIFDSDVAGTEESPNFDGLIGRDFLQFTRLSYFGPTGIVELADWRSEQKAKEAARRKRERAEQRKATKEKTKTKKKSRRKQAKHGRKAGRK